MNELKNSYDISKISFNKQICAYCPLGKDNYTANIEVTLFPTDKLFDFCDADKFLLSLSGKDAIVEKLTDIIFNYFKQYAQKLIVTVHAESNTHFPVSVTKEM